MTDHEPSGDPLERALAIAYRYVGRRERTERELREHLETRGIARATAAEVVAELCERGYVDDARYAQLFAQDKRALESWGNERIARTLRERGLSSELIESALERQDRGQELEQALAFLGRRCPEPPVQRRERDRALGLLLRKGYENELALEAVQLHAAASQSQPLR